MVVDSGCVVLEKWCVEGGIQPHHETKRERVLEGGCVGVIMS